MQKTNVGEKMLLKNINLRITAEAACGVHLVWMFLRQEGIGKKIHILSLYRVQENTKFGLMKLTTDIVLIHCTKPLSN